MSFLRDRDPEVADAIQKETKRQSGKIELIASENFVSEAVLEAQGSIMTNKYAEGYPGKRYYGGCEYVDIVENLAIERAKQIFGAEHVNVQPHSGTQANMAVYFAALNPGDTIMGMNLSHGGHLSHGSPVNFSGRYYNVVSYGVNKETELIDFNEVEEQAKRHHPKMIVVGASAYPRFIDFKIFREIADEVGAKFVVDMAHIAGLVAAGLHDSPIPYADIVTTTTHKTLRGPRGGMILCRDEFARDIDRWVFPGTQGGPLMHVIAGKAAAFLEALQPEFKSYQQQVVQNAAALAKALNEKGFNLVSGGTDNHLMLLNLGTEEEGGPSGKKMEECLDLAGITANKNTVPFDTRKPFVASGIRLGTPAVTTRGMKETEMKKIAEFIDRVLTDQSEEEIEKVRKEINEKNIKIDEIQGKINIINNINLLHTFAYLF